CNPGVRRVAPAAILFFLSALWLWRQYSNPRRFQVSQHGIRDCQCLTLGGGGEPAADGSGEQEQQLLARHWASTALEHLENNGFGGCLVRSSGRGKIQADPLCPG